MCLPVFVNIGASEPLRIGRHASGRQAYVWDMTVLSLFKQPTEKQSMYYITLHVICYIACYILPMLYIMLYSMLQNKAMYYVMFETILYAIQHVNLCGYITCYITC